MGVKRMDDTSPAATQPEIIKAVAVTAVMMQLILSVLLKQFPDVSHRIEIGMLYNLAKFSAPAFIFAILYDVAQLRDVKYGHYVWHKAKEIIGPYLFWTTVYILTVNAGGYEQVGDVVQAFLLGTAAPHLWYTVMMFQYHLLIPLVTALALLMIRNRKKAAVAWVVSIIVYAILILLYDRYVLLDLLHPDLVYTDRIFAMYGLFALLGMGTSIYKEVCLVWLDKMKWALLPIGVLLFIWVNRELFAYGFEDMNLLKSSYLKPSMVLFNMALILLLYAGATGLIRMNVRFLPAFRWIAKYAFRAYLASYFALNLTIWMMGSYVKEMPLGISIVFLLICTAILAFTMVYYIEKLCKAVMRLLRARNHQGHQPAPAHGNKRP
ncbi:acyltransferase [Paenibacillus sp. FSL R7-0313]|uniref:acyltransferase n=1 Tax=Paenibacillus sp. FSL R7-0313 TaxID=2954532 RepID=UPI0030DD6B89